MIALLRRLFGGGPPQITATHPTVLPTNTDEQEAA